MRRTHREEFPGGSKVQVERFELLELLQQDLVLHRRRILQWQSFID